MITTRGFGGAALTTVGFGWWGGELRIDLALRLLLLLEAQQRLLLAPEGRVMPGLLLEAALGLQVPQEPTGAARLFEEAAATATLGAPPEAAIQETREAGAVPHVDRAAGRSVVVPEEAGAAAEVLEEAGAEGSVAPEAHRVISSKE